MFVKIAVPTVCVFVLYFIWQNDAAPDIEKKSPELVVNPIFIDDAKPLAVKDAQSIFDRLSQLSSYEFEIMGNQAMSLYGVTLDEQVMTAEPQSRVALQHILTDGYDDAATARTQQVFDQLFIENASEKEANVICSNKLCFASLKIISAQHPQTSDRICELVNVDDCFVLSAHASRHEGEEVTERLAIRMTNALQHSAQPFNINWNTFVRLKNEQAQYYFVQAFQKEIDKRSSLEGEVVNILNCVDEICIGQFNRKVRYQKHGDQTSKISSPFDVEMCDEFDANHALLNTLSIEGEVASFFRCVASLKAGQSVESLEMPAVFDMRFNYAQSMLTEPPFLTLYNLGLKDKPLDRLVDLQIETLRGLVPNAPIASKSDIRELMIIPQSPNADNLFDREYFQYWKIGDNPDYESISDVLKPFLFDRYLTLNQDSQLTQYLSRENNKLFQLNVHGYSEQNSDDLLARIAYQFSFEDELQVYCGDFDCIVVLNDGSPKFTDSMCDIINVDQEFCSGEQRPAFSRKDGRDVHIAYLEFSQKITPDQVLIQRDVMNVEDLKNSGFDFEFAFTQYIDEVANNILTKKGHKPEVTNITCAEDCVITISNARQGKQVGETIRVKPKIDITNICDVIQDEYQPLIVGYQSANYRCSYSES